MKVTKEFILEAHKAACSDWKIKIEQEFPDLFPNPEYVVGGWYVHTISGAVIQYLGGSLGRGFDPIKGMVWAEKNIYSFKNNNNWELFTDIEKLKELFIDEAERRGLKHGNFESLFADTVQEKEHHDKYKSWKLNLCGYIITSVLMVFGLSHLGQSQSPKQKNK